MFCGQTASSLVWAAAQLHEHFNLPGMVLEMRCVGQARRGQGPFVPFVSSPHLGFIKVAVELRWLSALKVVLSTVLCCLLFCFITLMTSLCRGKK